MYNITRDYIRLGNSRSGQKLQSVRFIVSHDTGNPGSTAYNNWSYFNNNQPSASAHTFIDDKYILEMIPLNEKAWHVQYNKPIDNRMFGDDANDAAIGVELCWGGKINFQEAYKRYVWYHSYLCKTFNLDPRKHIVAHQTLDPERRSDPNNALKRHGITWGKFIDDVVKDFQWETKVLGVSKGDLSVRIKKGDKGEIVKLIHFFLAALGYTQTKHVEIDEYQDFTVDAVRRFQEDQKLRKPTPGVVDFETFSAFAKVLHVYYKDRL